MISRDFIFQFDYKPVGQGLFASGTIRRTRESIPCFTWVYDCGSSDSPDCLEREIDRLGREIGPRGAIDLLVLSHFDRDHVNGVASLLRRFQVRRLVIPYLPIENRLAYALSERAIGADYLEAVINPARHFVDIGGDNLGQIIYITGGDRNEPPGVSEGNPDLPPEGPLERMVKFPWQSEGTPGGEAGGTRDAWESKTLYVSDQHTLAIPGFWEFVFFNKKLKRAGDEFVRRLQNLLNDWNWGDRVFEDPQEFVDDLKDFYEDVFPAGKPRNDISLVTYSGPIYSSWVRCSSCFGASYAPRNASACFLDWWNFRGCNKGREEKASHLYFGDLNLNSKLLVKSIKPHFGEPRWRRILAVQVPHHGADPSWYAGASMQFGHAASVFSFGVDNTYKHPGKMARADLKSHGPILVNEYHGASFCGFLEREILDPS